MPLWSSMSPASVVSRTWSWSRAGWTRTRRPGRCGSACPSSPPPPTTLSTEHFLPISTWIGPRGPEGEKHANIESKLALILSEWTEIILTAPWPCTWERGMTEKLKWAPWTSALISITWKCRWIASSQSKWHQSKMRYICSMLKFAGTENVVPKNSSSPATPSCLRQSTSIKNLKMLETLQVFNLTFTESWTATARPSSRSSSRR